MQYRVEVANLANQPITITSVTQGASGNVVLNADGSVTYTPNAGFSGTDSYTYTVSDGHGGAANGRRSVPPKPGLGGVLVQPSELVVAVVTGHGSDRSLLESSIASGGRCWGEFRWLGSTVPFLSGPGPSAWRRSS